jgi:hypothetical protein
VCETSHGARRQITGLRSEWDNISAEAQAHIRNNLLGHLTAPPNGSLSRKVVNCLGDLASEQLNDDEESWPELLPTVLSATTSPEPMHQELGFEIFAQIAESCKEQIDPQVPIPLLAAVVEGRDEY